MEKSARLKRGGALKGGTWRKILSHPVSHEDEMGRGIEAAEDFNHP